FLMIRRPPRATLFPYPPLFRSLRDLMSGEFCRARLPLASVKGFRSPRRQFLAGCKTNLLAFGGFLHAVGQAGARGADFRVAREGVSRFGHRLATASANTGVHALVRRKQPRLGLTGGELS